MRLSYSHVFEPETLPKTFPLLVLHGTGGNERDLIPLARAISPGSALLSPRGDVDENGQLRFFRRLAEGVFDAEDVRRRTNSLAAFIASAATLYGFDQKKIIGLGFSNGANIAATLLQLHPGSLSGAILLRPMVVLEDQPPAGSLEGVRVFMSNGRFDPIIPLDQPPKLAKILRAGGARVVLHELEAGHGLIAEDVALARDWMTASSV